MHQKTTTRNKNLDFKHLSFESEIARCVPYKTLNPVEVLDEGTARLLTPAAPEPSQAKGHRSRAKSSTQLPSLQTPATNSKVPRPPSLLTYWLQISVSPQVQ